MQNLIQVQQAAESIKEKTGYSQWPKTGVILGTGLGKWCEYLKEKAELPYEQIANMPQSTVQSHSGKLVHGYLKETPIAVLQGRFHLYEEYTPDQVCFGVRLLKELGVQNLVITNAAGAINPYFQAGSLMLIQDQINLTGTNPLFGQNCPEWGPRFPDMSQVFDPDLTSLARETASSLGIKLEQGVYLGVHGPVLETPAETRFYRLIGGDAIGMSTVMETIAAKHLGMRILGISCLTNKNLPDCMQKTSIEQIIAQAEKTGPILTRLLNAMLPRI